MIYEAMPENDIATPPSPIRVDLFTGDCFSSEKGYAGVIVPLPTGVIYEAQVGEVLCAHAQLEGAFLPIDPEWCGEPLSMQWGIRDPEEAAREIEKDRDCLPEGLRPPTADELRAFSASPGGCSFAGEAWVPCVVSVSDETKNWDLRNLLMPFNGRTVVFVYPNSD